MTAFSKEENAIVERTKKEVRRHLNALLFDARVHDKWSYEQLPMVQRIMNTVEKPSTGVTPAVLILNNGIRLQARILAPPTSLGSAQQIALSDTMDEWIPKPLMSTHSSNMAHGSPSTLSTPMRSSHLPSVDPISYSPDTVVSIR